MDKYTVCIELLSEAVFGSGQAVSGSVDTEVLHDKNGLPYMKAKTIKGKLREEIESLIILSGKQDELKKILVGMFGCEYSNKEEREEKEGKLKFSDCTFDEGFIKYIELGLQQRNNPISPTEVLDALTETRYGIRMNEKGTAEDGSLRQIRVIKKGLKFYCGIYSYEELNEQELGFIAAGVSSLRHLGALESRGKGLVKCTLLKNGHDKTKDYLKVFLQKVVGINEDIH